MSEQLQIFFKKHHFQRFTISSLTENILNDMKKGLGIDGEDPDGACQPMIPVYGLLDEKPRNNKSFIVIDAGGINFRSALVHFNENGEARISSLLKSSMPGIEKELSKEEFYNAIADKIDYLKDKADKIGFCFSYAMEMNEENDGKVLVFSKEIKAPEVVGTFVGKELLAVLKKRGWKTVNKVVLLNDTVAALLSGLCHSTSESYSSCIGFVFGTGMNNAYIEAEDIPKINDNGKKHIVVCESGMYNNLLLSTFDEMLDRDSVAPGESLLEKMCSGGYMGKLAYIIMKTACEEHIFSGPFTARFKKITELKAVDIDEFLRNPGNAETVLGAVAAEGCITDSKKLTDILTMVIYRTASIITAVLSATILKCREGKSPDAPVAIVCNGSTFWKCHSLAETVKKLLYENLTGNSKAFFKIFKVENDIMLGTALAAARG